MYESGRGVPLVELETVNRQVFVTDNAGRVAILDRPDVDTDQIIPKQFLKRIERTGYGEFAFFDWRYDSVGIPLTGFELNRPEFAGAKVLVEALRRAGKSPTRERVLAALEGIRKLDIGGLEVTYGPDDHTGLDFADLAIIGSDGKFKR